MSATFRPGETLVVSPADDDDPIANAMNGQHCTFGRYTPVTAAGSRHAEVAVDGRRKPIRFRCGDLQKAEVRHEA